MTFRSRIYTTGALEAVVSGSLHVLRAPLLWLAIYLLTIAAVLPFAVVVGARVQSALASQQVTHDPQHALDADIDAEWWFEFIRHARGLEATFTPAIVGAAAPLTVLSAVLDGEPPAVALLAPIGIYATLWAFLWGGVLERLRHGRRGLGAFVAAGGRMFAPFLLLTLSATLVYLALYATLHALLFGPAFTAVREAAETELSAFLWRVLFYAVFGLCLIAVNLMVDYTRVFAVRDRISLVEALRAAAAFLRERWRSALGAYVLVGVVFAAVLAGYTVVDVYGGARVGGWRAVIIGQAFVFARVGLRLVGAASALALAGAGADRAHASTAEVKSGPPAAT